MAYTTATQYYLVVAEDGVNYAEHTIQRKHTELPDNDQRVHFHAFIFIG